MTSDLAIVIGLVLAPVLLGALLVPLQVRIARRNLRLLGVRERTGMIVLRTAAVTLLAIVALAWYLLPSRAEWTALTGTVTWSRTSPASGGSVPFRRHLTALEVERADGQRVRVTLYRVTGPCTPGMAFERPAAGLRARCGGVTVVSPRWGMIALRTVGVLLAMLAAVALARIALTPRLKRSSALEEP